MSTTGFKSRALNVAAALVIVAAGFEAASAQPVGSSAAQRLIDSRALSRPLIAKRAQQHLAQQQLVHGYIAQFGPEIEAAYQQFVQSTGMRAPFEQYAYQHLMARGQDR